VLATNECSFSFLFLVVVFPRVYCVPFATESLFFFFFFSCFIFFFVASSYYY